MIFPVKSEKNNVQKIVFCYNAKLKDLQLFLFKIYK